MAKQIKKIVTENLPWHIDYHKAGKYKPEAIEVENDTLNINNNGTKEEEVS